jgi:hypothetical protein
VVVRAAFRGSGDWRVMVARCSHDVVVPRVAFFSWCCFFRRGVARSASGFRRAGGAVGRNASGASVYAARRPRPGDARWIAEPWMQAAPRGLHLFWAERIAHAKQNRPTRPIAAPACSGPILLCLKRRDASAFFHAMPFCQGRSVATHRGRHGMENAASIATFLSF